MRKKAERKNDDEKEEEPSKREAKHYHLLEAWPNDKHSSKLALL